MSYSNTALTMSIYSYLERILKWSLHVRFQIPDPGIYGLSCQLNRGETTIHYNYNLLQLHDPSIVWNIATGWFALGRCPGLLELGFRHGCNKCLQWSRRQIIWSRSWFFDWHTHTHITHTHIIYVLYWLLDWCLHLCIIMYLNLRFNLI